jgi:predicted ATPase
MDAISIHENGQPRNIQCIIESHSEHLLRRLQRRMAEGAIDPAAVAIYFFVKQGTVPPFAVSRLTDSVAS